MSPDLKQRLRFLLRRRVHVLDDEVAFTEPERELERLYVDRIEGTFDARDREFVQHRFFESVRLRRAIEVITGERLARKRVLDVGAGNGAFAAALAAGGTRAVAVDATLNGVALQLASQAGFDCVTADSRKLPFAHRSFDVVTAFETIEHLRDIDQCASETLRVLKPRGYLCITTPPRLRYLFRRDPHFGIPFLLSLPDSLQRATAARRGFAGETHHVEHTFWTSWGISSAFPGTRTAAVIGRSFVPWLSWDLIVLQKK